MIVTPGTIGIMSGIPFLYTEFVASLLRLTLSMAGSGVVVAFATKSDHAVARNELAEQSRGEWLWMTDCDHRFEHDILHRLLETMYSGDEPLPVVTGVYFQRTTHLPLLYRWAPEGKGGVSQIVQFPRDAIFPVDAAGGGCLLVQRSVFHRIRDELGREPFDNVYDPHIGRISEDLSFFANCRDLGIPVWCDSSVLSTHLAITDVGWAEHETATQPDPSTLRESTVLAQLKE